MILDHTWIRFNLDKTEYSLLHNTYSIVKTSLLYIVLSKVQCRILENLQGHHQARLYIIDRLRLFGKLLSFLSTYMT